MSIDTQAASNALAALDNTVKQIDQLVREGEEANTAALGALREYLTTLIATLRADAEKSVAGLTTSVAGLTTKLTKIDQRLTQLEVAALPPAAPMKLASPQYSYPGATWTQVLAKGPSKMGLVVMNPSSGPGSVINPDYSKLVTQILASGVKFINYVPTNYLDKYSVAADGVKRDPANVQNILDEITRIQNWYPSGGIFLDEMNNTGDAVSIATYNKIRDFIKTKYGASQIVALNPGTSMPEQCMPCADLFMRFESTAAKYKTFVPPTWHAKYPGRFWDCIHSTLATEWQTIFTAAQKNKPGLVWITDDVPPNPYNANPTFLDAMAALV